MKKRVTQKATNISKTEGRVKGRTKTLTFQKGSESNIARKNILLNLHALLKKKHLKSYLNFTPYKEFFFFDLGSYICRIAGRVYRVGNFLKMFYLFIFTERGREGERGGEKHQCVVASHAPPTGNLACNPGMCPDWELNW